MEKGNHAKTKLTDFNAPYIFPLTVILIFEINEVSLSTLEHFGTVRAFATAF